MAPSNSELIFLQWEAALKNKDRSKDNVANNFDDLFSALKSANVSFDEAFGFLEKATKAHYPNPAVVKNTWKVRLALHNIFASEAEFANDWKASIKSDATDTFFSNYPLKPKDDDDDGEPKVFGNMSVKEYKLQRKYADAFPRLNTDELVKQMKERKSLLGDLTHVLGGKNDDK